MQSYFKIIETEGKLDLPVTSFDYRVISKIAKTFASKYLDDQFRPYTIKREPEVDPNEERIINQKEKPGYNKTFDEIRQEQSYEHKELLKVEEFAIVSALEVFSKQKFKAALLQSQTEDLGDPEELFENCLQQAKEQCRNWKKDYLDDYSELIIMNDQNQDAKQENEPEEENIDLEEKYQDILMNTNREFMKQIDEIQKELNNTKNIQQTSKVVSIMHSLKISRGVIITGPRCSGKTSILRILGLLLKKQENQIDMKISMLNPDIYDINKLYASADSGITNPEILCKRDGNTKISSITSSVIKIILDRFEKIGSKSSEGDKNENSVDGEDDKEIEKRIEIDSQEESEAEVLKPKIMKTLLFESSNIDPLWSDCLIDYFKIANNVNDLCSKTIDNLEDTNDLNNSVPIYYPNGATGIYPKDLFMFFECDSLANASPSFLSNVAIVSTDESTITWEKLFTREKSKLKQFTLKQPFSDLGMPFEHFENTINEFVIPFVKKLNSTARIKSQPSWNMKSLVVRFYKLLDGLLTNLICIERDLRNKDDPVFLPTKTKSQTIINNLLLMSVVWSFGAILNQDLRRLFEDYFLQYKRKFDTKLSSHAGKSAKDSLFEKAFDIERMQWDLISERVSSKLGNENGSKGFLDAQRQQIIVPSLEISQGLLLFDILMHRKCYHILFEGAKASHKTTVLSNISRLKKYNYRSIWIPMNATVTIDKARYVFEQFFKTSENRFIMTPVDEMKHIFIIDDLHLEDSLNTKFSEFFRMWDTYGGYYHIENGFFVNIDKLRLMLSKNNEPNPRQTRANDRLTYYINSIYFDELDNDRFRMFIQNWLTNKSVSNTSKLVNKFYILITNSLMSIKEKMTRNDSFSESQIMPVFNFHHFVRL